MPSLKFFYNHTFPASFSLTTPNGKFSEKYRHATGQIYFRKDSFTSHVSFISSCLRLQVIPRGFQIKFHPGFPTTSTSLNNIDRSLSSCSRSLMRKTILDMNSRTRYLTQNLIAQKSMLRASCAPEMANTVIQCIRTNNSKLYDFLMDTKKSELDFLRSQIPSDPHITCQKTKVVTIPEDMELSDDTRSVLGKGLNYIPLESQANHTQVYQDAEAFFRRLRLKAFFHDNQNSRPPQDQFEKLQPPTSDWTPRSGQLHVLDQVIDKTVNDINLYMLKPRTCKSSNLTSGERKALNELRSNPDIIVKPADKGGAIVVWSKDLYVAEAKRQLTDTTTYAPLPKDPMDEHQKLIKSTVTQLITNAELPSTATNLINSSPATASFYMLPKIHKPNCPGRPISSHSCPTIYIAQFIDEILRPIVSALPSYVQDSSHALCIFNDQQFGTESVLLFTMDVCSLYTSIPYNEGLDAIKYYLDRRSDKNPSTATILRLTELVLKTQQLHF